MRELINAFNMLIMSLIMFITVCFFFLKKVMILILSIYNYTLSQSEDKALCHCIERHGPTASLYDGLGGDAGFRAGLLSFT